MNSGSYVDDNSETAYYLANGQITIDLRRKVPSSELNDVGINKFLEIMKQVANNEFKGILEDYFIDLQNSGFWSPDTNSKFHQNDDPLASLNTPNNRVVRGKLNGKTVQTSTVLFLTDDWCYTYSGSLYKFGNCLCKWKE